jgi:hypothetical protein
VLRVAQEVRSTPAEADRDVFDFVEAMRPTAEHSPTAEPNLIAQPEPAPTPYVFAPARPMVSRTERDDMERRVASYRAFQMKLNEDREARIRRTMEDIRAGLKRSAPDSTQH